MLLSFIEPLSTNGIPIFAISTYDTDYVLVQEEFAGRPSMHSRRPATNCWPWDESARWNKLHAFLCAFAILASSR